MGYYIETERPTGKAYSIVSQYGGQIVPHEIAENAISDPSKGVIVVVSNGFFEAAGFAYNAEEFQAFTLPEDTRPKQYIVMDRSKVKELIPRYKGE